MDPRQQYERDGFLVLPGFVPASACDALITRAAEIVAGLTRPAETRPVSIFSTRDQIRTTGYLFAALVFWSLCFALSRYSARLDRSMASLPAAKIS